MKTNSGKRKETRRKGQLSLEMMLVLAALVFFVGILFVQMQKTATNGAQAVEIKAQDFFDKLNNSGEGLKRNGMLCSSDDECKSGYCSSVSGKCEAQ